MSAYRDAIGGVTPVPPPPPSPAPGAISSKLPGDMVTSVNEMTNGLIKLDKLAKANLTRISDNEFKDSVILAAVTIPGLKYSAGQKINLSTLRDDVKDSIYQTSQLAKIILEIRDKGTITNPDNNEARPVTRKDLQVIFGLLARQAEIFTIQAQLADMLSLNGLLADVFKRTMRDFAQLAADFYSAGRKVIEGANRTLGLIGDWFPLVALGAGGFALYVYTKGKA